MASPFSRPRLLLASGTSHAPDFYSHVLSWLAGEESCVTGGQWGGRSEGPGRSSENDEPQTEGSPGPCERADGQDLCAPHRTPPRRPGAQRVPGQTPTLRHSARPAHAHAPPTRTPRPHADLDCPRVPSQVKPGQQAPPRTHQVQVAAAWNSVPGSTRVLGEVRAHVTGSVSTSSLGASAQVEATAPRLAPSSRVHGSVLCRVTVAPPHCHSDTRPPRTGGSSPSASRRHRPPHINAA